MKTKNEYIEQLAAQLKDWSAEIDLLSAKADAAAASAKLHYVEELDALRAKQQEAHTKLKELQDSGGEGWDALKATADKVWNDLSTGLKEVVSKFN